MRVRGWVEPGFEPVRGAFESNFASRGEVGAACCVYLRGRPVVDVWGGIADRKSGREWGEDTLALVFSTTKGVTSICAHLLSQCGELDLDAPVCSYWPEFAVEGKAATTVRHLLAHRAGLPVIQAHLSPEQAMAWHPAVEALAAQAPLWAPGARHGYHALTFGWLVGEVIRRVAGRSVGRIVAEDLAGPLGLDLWVGLPESEEPRVCRLIAAAQPSLRPEELEALAPDKVQQMRDALDPGSLLRRALEVTDPPFNFNTRAIRAGEQPAANGISTARALARLYASTVGEVDGIRVLSPRTVADATVEQSSGPDAVIVVENRFGSGFFLASPFSPLLGPSSFGHAGAGGSLAFADPDAEIGFAYVMNQMQQDLSSDPRPAALIDAVRTCLSRGPGWPSGPRSLR